jgi:hypothetical protein
MKLLWAAALVMAALALVRFERPLRAQALANPLNNWSARAEHFRDVLEYLGNVDGPFITKLTPEQASADEQQLAANPEDEKARLELSVYYFTTSQAESRLQLVNWMIDHHPDSALHALLSLAVAPTRDGSGPYTDAVDRWPQLAAHPNDANVLLNAAKAIGQASPSEEITLLKEGQSLDHDRFTGLLAQYYAGALQSPPGIRAVAQAAVRTDLAGSTDPALLGSTGALLSERAISAAAMHRPDYDLESIRALSLDLLARAQALDPTNQKWPDAAEGARRLTVSPDTVAVTTPLGAPTRIRIGAAVAKANLITAPEPEKTGIEGKSTFRSSSARTATLHGPL